MSDSSSTFVLVATYPDEAAAQGDYQVIKDAHAQGVVGSYDAAGAAVGAVSGHLAKGMSRSDAQQLGDFIDPGQAALVVIGENKVEDAIKKAVTGAEKQTARDLDVDPKDIDKTLQQTVKEM